MAPAAVEAALEAVERVLVAERLADDGEVAGVAAGHRGEDRLDGGDGLVEREQAGAGGFGDDEHGRASPASGDHGRSAFAAGAVAILPGWRRGPCAPVGARLPHPPSPRPQGRGNLPDRDGRERGRGCGREGVSRPCRGR